jgi:hypothetical protein
LAACWHQIERKTQNEQMRMRPHFGDVQNRPSVQRKKDVGASESLQASWDDCFHQPRSEKLVKASEKIR